MKYFVALLIILFISLGIYTIEVINLHGFWVLGDIFSSDVKVMNWSGQFNLDFISVLVVISCWIAWRHQFSAIGILLALLLSVSGGLYFFVYLIVEVHKAKYDVNKFLLGKNY